MAILSSATIFFLYLIFQVGGASESVHRSEPQTLRVGSTFEMSCQFFEDANSILVWGKNSKYGDAAISPYSALSNDSSRNRSVTFHHPTYTTYVMRIAGLSVSDEGNYSCAAINLENKNSSCVTYRLLSEASLVLLKPAKIFENSSTSMTVKEGTEISLQCYATGYPPPVIFWKKEDDATLPTGTTKHPFSELKFRVTKESVGVYSCFAINGVEQPTTRTLAVNLL